MYRNAYKCIEIQYKCMEIHTNVWKYIQMYGKATFCTIRPSIKNTFKRLCFQHRFSGEFPG